MDRLHYGSQSQEITWHSSDLMIPRYRNSNGQCTGSQEVQIQFTQKLEEFVIPRYRIQVSCNEAMSIFVVNLTLLIKMLQYNLVFHSQEHQIQK